MIHTGTLRKAWKLLNARERRQAGLLLFVAGASALLEMAMVGSILPFLTVLANPETIQERDGLQWAYSTFGFTSNYNFVMAVGVLSLISIIVASIAVILRRYMMIRFALMRQHTIGHRLLAAYLERPYEYFMNRHTGDMAKSVLEEAGQVAQSFFMPVANLTASIMTTLALVGFLFWVDPGITVTALVLFGGVYGSIYAISRTRVTRLGRTRLEANSERFRFANEALSGLKDIKILGRESNYLDRYKTPSLRMTRAAASVRIISELPAFAVRALVMCSVIAVCLIFVDAEEFAAGTFVANTVPILAVFALAAQRLLPAIAAAYSSITILRYASVAIESVYDDLSMKVKGPASHTSLPSADIPALRLHEAIDLDNVTFSYAGAKSPSLRNVSVRIEAGQRIGIVGGTGSGKTTMADIVLGLLTPMEGRLLVDGHEITPDNVRNWRRSVGYVPQDIFLPDGTVTENIALGVPAAQIDATRVRECARLACIEEFIDKELPDGFDSQVGERGVRLSGGQRQRIGIARALYHDADVIVFDEATSALDNATEQEVMTAIDALPGNKTILIIAHRLSTVRSCDRIAVLEAGHLAGYAQWSELSETNETFRKLVKLARAA